MSRFHNIACTVCKKDTLHYAGKCRECGNLFVWPSAQAAKARRRHAVFVKYGRTRGLAFSEAQKQLALEAGPSFEWNERAQGKPVGAGRERVKA